MFCHKFCLFLIGLIETEDFVVTSLHIGGTSSDFIEFLICCYRIFYQSFHELEYFLYFIVGLFEDVLFVILKSLLLIVLVSTYADFYCYFTELFY